MKESAIFVDKGVSGCKHPKQRGGFKALLNYIQEQSVDEENILVVYEISRLGRSFYEILTLIMDLEESGVKVISLSDKESFLNTTDPSHRKLIMSIFIWCAERERELLVDGTKMGV